MTKVRSFQRFAALSAVLSFPLAIASNVLQGLPTNFNSDIFTNPTLMLSIGANGASLMRWGLILDMLGYYLLLLPSALFLHTWCGSKSRDWVRFYSLCGFGYILVGAAGAAILASVHPPLITAYAQGTSAAQRAVIETVFINTWNVVYGGLWNVLGELLAGVWLIGIGWLLRGERRFFSVITLLLGLGALLDSLGTVLGIGALALPGLSIFVGLLPIWALWLGIDLLRKPVQIQSA